LLGFRAFSFKEHLSDRYHDLTITMTSVNLFSACHLSQHLNALCSRYTLFISSPSLSLFLGIAPTFEAFSGPYSTENTLLLWWGATVSSDQRDQSRIQLL
jgi:hypothetical protein